MLASVLERVFHIHCFVALVQSDGSDDREHLTPSNKATRKKFLVLCHEKELIIRPRNVSEVVGVVSIGLDSFFPHSRMKRI